MRTGGLTESPSSPPHYLAPRADGLEKDRCHFEQSAAHLFAANRRRLSREPRECQCPENVTTDIGYEKLSVSVSVKSHTNQRLRWTASTPLRRTRRISDTRQPPNSSPALMYTRTSGCEVGIVAVGMSAASRSLILGASNPRKSVTDGVPSAPRSSGRSASRRPKNSSEKWTRRLVVMLEPFCHLVDLC